MLIEKLLQKLNLEKTEIDQWYLHQGSKYIVDTITQRLSLEPEKVVFNMYDYGNSISSSIPMLLSEDLSNFKQGQKFGVSGFGVGLSWASAIFEMK